MSHIVNHIFFVVLVITMLAFSILKRKLTTNAALTGGFIALCVYVGLQFTGMAMLGTFFVLGTAATAWQKARKNTALGFEPERRKSSQVIANGGVAALCGILCFIFPGQQIIFSLMMAASLSTATADTLSSELGTLYGTRFINIITLKPDRRGLDGVISLQGLVIGLLGSSIISTIYIAGTSTSAYHFIIVVIAGTTGNLSDSLLGALFERRKKMGNDAVNFTATLIGAMIAGVWFIIK